MRTTALMMGGSRARRFGVVFIGVLLSAAAVRFGCQWWLAQELSKEVARLEARYGTLRLWSGSDAGPDNRARTLHAAVDLLDGAQLDALYKQGLLSWTDLPLPIPDGWHIAVDRNAEAISLAVDALRRSKSDWSFRRDRDMPPFRELRDLSNFLCVDACIKIEEGQSDQAAQLLTAGIGIASSLVYEPVLVSQLIRIAISRQQFLGIRRLLIDGDPSDAALAALSTELARNRRAHPMVVGLLAELREGHDRWQRLEAGDASVFRDKVRVWVGPLAVLGRPAVEAMHLVYLREMDKTIAALSTLPAAPVQALPPKHGWWLGLVDEWLAGTARAGEPGNEFLALQAVAEIGVALRRYRMAHGEYPPTLAPLAPDYLPNLPIDPYTAAPPKYSRLEAGFELKAGVETVPTYDRRAFVWQVNR